MALTQASEGGLKISNAGTNGQYLQKQSGNTGGLTWADVGGAASITFNDSVAANFGTDGDQAIWHTGSVGYIRNSTGGFCIRNDNFSVKDDGESETMLTALKDGAVELYYDNTKRFETVSDGIRWTGHCYANDNYKLRLGTGEDLQIYHDATNSWIDNGAGNLLIRDNTGDIYLQAPVVSLQGGTSESNKQTAKFTAGGAVELYYDNVKKFETKSYGANMPDDSQLYFGSDDDAVIKHTGSHFYMTNATGNWYMQPKGGETAIEIIPDGKVGIRYDNTEKLATTSEGIKVSGDVWINSTAFDPDNGAFDAANYPLVIQNPEDTNGDSTGIGFAVTTATDKIGAAIHHVRTAGGSQGEMRFLTNGDGNSITERMRMRANGDIYVNCTSEPDTGNVAGVAFIENNSSELRMSTGSQTSEATRIRFYNDDGQAGRIYIDGSTTSYVTSSDYRLKENQVAISDGITRLKLLKPYRFNWKKHKDVVVDGFFAHEVTPAVPEAIGGEKDAVNEDGSIKPQDIDQSKLVPLLTAALQEAITKIETLETKVAALEAA